MHEFISIYYFMHLLLFMNLLSINYLINQLSFICHLSSVVQKGYRLVWPCSKIPIGLRGSVAKLQ